MIAPGLLCLASIVGLVLAVVLPGWQDLVILASANALGATSYHSNTIFEINSICHIVLS